MNRRLLIILVFATLLVLPGCDNGMLTEHPVDLSEANFEAALIASAIAYHNQSPVTLSGRVILCSLNNAGNPNVKITLNGIFDKRTAYTDSGGEFSFNDIRPGDFELSASKQGHHFQPEILTITVGANGVNNIIIETSLSWEKTIGGSGWDRAYSIHQNRTDCGYIISGYSDSGSDGNFNFFIVRLDILGNIISSGTIWPQQPGGMDTDVGFSVTQDALGNIITVGATESYGSGLSDLWIMKIDQDNGMEIQEDTEGGTEWDEGRCVIALSDGGFAVAGDTASDGSGLADYWVVKYNSELGFQWDHANGTDEADKAFSIIEDTTDANSLISTGSSNISIDDGGGSRVGVLKLKSNGDFDWVQTYTYGLYNESYGICNANEGYVIGGYSKESDFEYGNSLIFKINKDGAPIPVWSKIFDYGNLSIIRAISVAADGGYIACGYLYSSSNDYDVLVIKLDASGNKEWDKFYNNISVNGEEKAFSIHSTSDGGYILAGYTQTANNKNDIWILKLNQSGDIVQ